MAAKRKPEKVGPPERLRVNVDIDADLRKRMGAYASYHRYTEAQVVEAALTDKLKGFYVGQREPGGSVTIAPGTDGDDRQVLAIRTG